MGGSSTVGGVTVRGNLGWRKLEDGMEVFCVFFMEVAENE